MAKAWREQVHNMTREEIKRIAHQLLAEKGASALSMRAIAREMKTTPPALYYYYGNRNELITALVIDAYTSLGATLELADQKTPQEEYTKRAQALLLAYRHWALTHPNEFKLIYGTPIPGYEVPIEITAAAAGRGVARFVEICEAALSTQELVPPDHELPKILETQFSALGEARKFNAPASLIHLAVTGWTKLHGLVSLELYGHLELILGQTETLYQYEIKILLKELGFSPSQEIEP